MEGITEISKDKYIDNCLKIVKEMIHDENFSDELWIALTNEIMDTCLFIGGDFSDDNIRDITNQYLNNDGIQRFKRAHGVL